MPGWPTRAKSIDRVDRAIHRIIRRIVLLTVTGANRKSINPFGIALAGHSAWVTGFDRGPVAEVNTTTGQVTRVPDGAYNREILALGFGSL